MVYFLVIIFHMIVGIDKFTPFFTDRDNEMSKWGGGNNERYQEKVNKINIKQNVMKYTPNPYIVSYWESHPICNCSVSKTALTNGDCLI
jgi:hypothetical protein